MGKRVKEIRFKGWLDQEVISSYIQSVLQGTWRNSSGCWDKNCLHIWYQKSEDTTYVHFPCDYCYTWKGNVVRAISKRLKRFIKWLT